MNPDGLMVNPMQFSRLTIPIHTTGDYRLDLELTRKWGTSEVQSIFSCWQQNLHVVSGAR